MKGSSLIDELRASLDSVNALRASLESVSDSVPPESEDLSAWILSAIDRLYGASGCLERAVRRLNDANAHQKPGARVVNKTLTDLLIERGYIDDMPRACTLDGPVKPAYYIDISEEGNPQKEEKSRE